MRPPHHQSPNKIQLSTEADADSGADVEQGLLRAGVVDGQS